MKEQVDQTWRIKEAAEGTEARGLADTEPGRERGGEQPLSHGLCV